MDSVKPDNRIFGMQITTGTRLLIRRLAACTLQDLDLTEDPSGDTEDERWRRNVWETERVREVTNPATRLWLTPKGDILSTQDLHSYLGEGVRITEDGEAWETIPSVTVRHFDGRRVTTEFVSNGDIPDFVRTAIIGHIQPDGDSDDKRF